MNDWVQCPDHKDNCKKIFELCQTTGIQGTKIARVENDISRITNTIFGEGESDTIKSRLQKVEDEVGNIEKLVLENREVVSTNMKGLFKIFVMTISAASVIICIAFGVMWAELKSVNNTVASLQQLREPSPSPQLPFRTKHHTEGVR